MVAAASCPAPMQRHRQFDRRVERRRTSSFVGVACAIVLDVVLAFLFPKIQAILETYASTGISTSRERRRTSPRLSERSFALGYFRLAPQPASWGRSEIESILDAGEPEPPSRS